MGKRIYRAISVNKIHAGQIGDAGEHVVLGCDAAKEKWYGAWMSQDREVRETMRWDVVKDASAVLELMGRLRESGVRVTVAVEPTGTYADAMVGLFLREGYDVYRVSAKHSHDYQEIYDGVPSGHDAKSAAIVAKLHLERGPKSRRWVLPDAQRRELRALADELDWVKRDEQRALSRLESRLARHWPELERWVGLTSLSALRLLAHYGSPAAVAASAEASGQLLSWSRGNLHSNKIAGVVDSARQTIGLPMEPAECEQLKHLATKLLELRQQRKQAEVALQGAVQRNDELASISSMVGCATAGVLTARLGNLVDYTSVRALLRAPGLNLKEHSSGKKRGQLSLSKRGSSTARRWLYLATLRWIKANATVRAWYERKARRTDIKHKAIVALMRKLLAALYHVARGAEFDETKLFDCRRLQLS